MTDHARLIDDLPGINPDGSVSTRRMSDTMKDDNARLIEEAKALHQDHFGTCSYCRGPWPCDANQLANALEKAEAENQQLKDHYQQAIKDLKELKAKIEGGEG